MFQQSEVPSMKLPLFLGYFEDSHFRKGLSHAFMELQYLYCIICPGHYQSIVPFEDSAILRTIMENGGCDVRSRLRLEYTGQFYFDIVLIIFKCLS